MYEISHMLGNKRGSVIKVSFPHAPSPPSRPPPDTLPSSHPFQPARDSRERRRAGGQAVGSELLWTEAGHSRLFLQCVQSPVPGEGVIVGKGPSSFPEEKGPWDVQWGVGAEMALLVGSYGAGALAGSHCLGRKCPLCS